MGNTSKANRYIGLRLLTRILSPPEYIDPRSPSFLGIGSTFYQEPLSRISLEAQTFHANRRRSSSARGSLQVVTTLKSLFPSSSLEELSTESNSLMPSSHFLDTAFFKLLVFAAVNNFAGLNKTGVEEIFQALQQTLYEQLQLLFELVGGLTFKALASKLFPFAIRSGIVPIVEFLIRDQSTGVNAKSRVILEGGYNFTPIGLACRYQQIATAELLLKYGADANHWNMADRRYNCCALDLAIPIEDRHEINLELVQLLLRVGAKFRPETLHSLILRKDEKTLEMLMRSRASSDFEDWLRAGVLQHCIEKLSNAAATEIVRMMLALGMDANIEGSRVCVVGYSDDHCFVEGDWRSILEVAAHRGWMNLVRILLESGARLSTATLVHAIKSMNMDLVYYLVDQGVAVHKTVYIASQRAYTSPFAEAILTKDISLVQHLVQRGGMRQVKNYTDFLAALRAASTVGNAAVVKALIGIVMEDPSLDGHCLEEGIVAAIEAGQDNIVLLLIQNGVRISSSTLLVALRKRKRPIVEAILREGVDPVNDYEYLEPLILEAVLWGDHSILKSLISMGFAVDHSGSSFCDPPIIAAVRKKDKALIELLLDAGASIKTRPTTVLTAAVATGDISIVRFFFHKGADPNDSEALLEATSRSKEILTLVLQEFSSKYSRGVKGYGSQALMAVIDKNDIEMIRAVAVKADIASLCRCQEPDSKLANITPFGFAIQKGRSGNIAGAQLLLENGANPNSIVSRSLRNEEQTALLMAVSTKSPEMVELLLKHSASINYPLGRCTYSPLQKAAEIGSYEIVQLLLEQGAAVNAVPYLKRGTALQLAASGGYLGIALLLLEKGADVNALSSPMYGRTPLEAASEHGRLDMVKVILQAGADTRRDDHRQLKAAMQLARKNGHFATLDLLRSHDSGVKPSMRDVLTDGTGWTFRALETNEGFEAVDATFPVGQEMQKWLPAAEEVKVMTPWERVQEMMVEKGMFAEADPSAEIEDQWPMPEFDFDLDTMELYLGTEE